MTGEPNQTAVEEAEAEEAANQNEKRLCNYNFSWKPKLHLDAMAAERNANNRAAEEESAEGTTQPVTTAAMAYFHHVTNFVAQYHGTSTRGRKNLEPNKYLNVEVTEDQLYLIQPTPADVLVGNILQDSIGNNSKKKIAKRRIDFITGNVASYSRSLNNSETLGLISDTNKLASCLATISEAKERAKDAAKEKKVEVEQKKKSKKAKDKEKFESEKAKVYHELDDIVGKGFAHVSGLKNKKQLLNLLKYYFQDTTPNQSKMSRDDLVHLVQKLLKAKYEEDNNDIKGEVDNGIEGGAQEVEEGKDVLKEDSGCGGGKEGVGE